MDESDTSVEEDLVEPVPFDDSVIPFILNLHCGDSQSGNDATYWIHGTGNCSVRAELELGTRVWTYRNSAGDIVGFGSLGLRRWVVNSAQVVTQYIPMLGVFSEFQGEPKSGVKYCYQIVDHLLDEAEEIAARTSMVTLAVYPDNLEAIHVYEKSGFAWLQDTEGYNLMFVNLSPPSND